MALINMPKRFKIGDILEIPTKRGLAYVQYSHYQPVPPLTAQVIRVLPGFFVERPKEFQALAKQKELYYTLFPVGAAVRRNIFAVVGHAELPPVARRFPLFRASGPMNPATGKVDHWGLWDGEREWNIEKLTDEQLDLPIRAGLNDLALIFYLEQGWTPRKADAFIQAARLKAKVKQSRTVKGIRHFLLYRSMQLARDGQELLLEGGFMTEFVEANDTAITLMVKQTPPFTEEHVESTALRLVEIAEKSRGTYDSWETEVG